MGVYDTIDRRPIKCPTCGHEINNWQSKSGLCVLDKITPEQLIKDAERLHGSAEGIVYYGYCDNCWANGKHTCIEYEFIAYWKGTVRTKEHRGSEEEKSEPFNEAWQNAFNDVEF